MCVVYNENDWPITPEDEEMSDIQFQHAYQPKTVAEKSHTKPAIVSAQPLSLLSARMRGYSEKGGAGSGGSDHGYILDKEQVASPTERSTPAAKANIQQAEVPHLRLNQVVSHSRLNTRAPCTVLGAADANAIKKAAAKPRGRAQVVLKQTREEKENLPLASPDPDDGINNLFQAAGAQSTPEEDEKEKRQPFMDIVPPNPFLDSDNEYDDLATRKWRENRGKTAEEPDSDQEIFSFDDISSCPTVPDLPDVLDQAVLKSFLHAPTAAKKGRHVAWKDKPARYRFYQLPNCNDFWSQIGLKSRPL